MLFLSMVGIELAERRRTLVGVRRAGVSLLRCGPTTAMLFCRGCRLYLSMAADRTQALLYSLKNCHQIWPQSETDCAVTGGVNDVVF